ncbi:hypothetical protein HaLaN_18335 [Haematococcus lacustris]|uniref:Uncharacterized protein n=1 Tax=Haematococcus lacustris TaxID=44745 RepID=A0A699ZEF5_HAELA|nr:hypothetical protein HaLaN_18335 [Haematococcus lacustris]
MDHCGMIITPFNSRETQLLVKATACLIAYRVMGKEKRKGANRQNKGLAKKSKGSTEWLGNIETPGDQGPGWRCAARLQEDQAQATGAPPDAG